MAESQNKEDPQEPSMEEILSSIRKIIRSDGEDGQAPSAPRGDNVLDLTEMVREDGSVSKLDPAREPLSLNEVDIVDVEQPSVATILSRLQSERDAIDATGGQSGVDRRSPDAGHSQPKPHDTGSDPSAEISGKTIDLDASDIVETPEAEGPRTSSTKDMAPRPDTVEPSGPAREEPPGPKRRRGILGVHRKSGRTDVDADAAADRKPDSGSQDTPARPPLHAVPSPMSQPEPVAEPAAEADGDGSSSDYEPVPERAPEPVAVSIVPEDGIQSPHGDELPTVDLEQPFQSGPDVTPPASAAKPRYGTEPAPATFVVEKTVEEILAEAAAEDAERTLASLAGADPGARSEETTADAYTLSVDEAVVEEEAEDEPPVSRGPEVAHSEATPMEVIDQYDEMGDETESTASPEPSVVRADRPSGADLATAVTGSSSIGTVDADRKEPTGGDGSEGSEGELSMEQMVRDALVPVLKEYLDENLKPIIERIVREETRKILLGRKAK